MKKFLFAFNLKKLQVYPIPPILHVVMGPGKKVYISNDLKENSDISKKAIKEIKEND